MALNPVLKELVKRHSVPWADRVADLECSVFRQGATIERLTAELKAAKAEVKAARLEVRLVTAAQAQEQARHDLDYAYWMHDQEGEEKAA